jgi:hypothetical protein
MVTQTNIEWEQFPCHSSIGCASSALLSGCAGRHALSAGKSRGAPRRTGRFSKVSKIAAC